MNLTVKTSDPAQTAADLLVVPILAPDRGGLRLSPALRALDGALGGVIAPAVASGDFEGRRGSTALVYPSGKGRKGAIQRVLLVGLGRASKLTLDGLRRAAGSAVKRAGSGPGKRISIAVPRLARLDAEEAAQALAEGACLGAYRFDAFQTGAAAKRATTVRSVTLFFDGAKAGPTALRRAAQRGLAIAESQNVARDLSNAPGNELPPAALASAARKVAREVGLRASVMDVAELKRRKMGGILAVGGGSANPPRLITLEHRPPAKAAAAAKRHGTLCLVGKGITFDSGGISIKPSAGMDEMKHDMGGAAAVVGAMRACALLELPLHVVGVIGSAENMPGGRAYRPGDVVRTSSGKTIEVLNTDAEGRVVLSDVLTWVQQKYKPTAIVDLATLTGACMVALGPWATGAFGNDDELVERICGAGEACAERVWPMPLLDEHREAVKSKIGDVKNTAGRDAGASTAAAFLDAFVDRDTPWVHLDIAGTGWTRTAGPYQPIGATGVGVRLLVELLRSWASRKRH